VFFQLLNWQSLLDILLFATGIFFLYRTLISFGAWKIVYGVLIAVVFFVVSIQLGLKGIEWIYRNVSQVAVLSLIVLFQPELRRLFEKAASLRRQKGRGFDEQFLGLIAQNLIQMAQKNIGAIIVIPGKESIEAWVKGGFPLNASPSGPLILSIFDPNSPGHDGALILQDGMFKDFGVRLPVSQSGRLSDEYGTRHQAAMGLCEKTDAMIAVVSEERGNISIFHKGSMHPAEEQNTLIEMMTSHCRDTGFFDRLRSTKKPGKSLWIEIIASLIVASVFWFSIISDQGELLEKFITAPVEYTATAENVVLSGEKINDARLHLSGSKSDLNMISPGSLRVKIDLSKVAAGEQMVLINEDNIRLPKGIKLLDVEPGSVTINIVTLSRIEVPVKPQIIGSLPKKVKLKAIKVIPERISVFMPSVQSGDSPKSIITTPIYLESIQETTTLFCKIISSPQIQPVEKRWPDVEVTIVVEPESIDTQ